MSDEPFAGRVLNGRVRLDQRAAFRQRVRQLEDQRVELIIRPERSTRTIQQNKGWWGHVLPEIGVALGYERNDRRGLALLHYGLVEECFGTHHDEKSGLRAPNVRSSRLSTVEFSHLMEWAVRWMATEHGAVISLPSEVLYSEE